MKSPLFWLDYQPPLVSSAEAVSCWRGLTSLGSQRYFLGASLAFAGGGGRVSFGYQYLTWQASQA